MNDFSVIFQDRVKRDEVRIDSDGRKRLGRLNVKKAGSRGEFMGRGTGPPFQNVAFLPTS